MWRVEGERRSRELLRKACIDSLLNAEDLRLTSIAFPAISSGIFGMPKEVSAVVLFSAVGEYAEGSKNRNAVVSDIRFVIIDDPTVEVFKEEFKFLYGEIDDETPDMSKTRKIKERENSGTGDKAKASSTESDKRAPEERPKENETKGGSKNKGRPKGKSSQNQAFTQERFDSNSKADRNNDSSMSYSAALQGKGSSSSAAMNQTSPQTNDGKI